MATVREIEARLARDVEDAVLGRLGYREWRVWLPGGLEVLPRPAVKEMSFEGARRSLGEQVLAQLGDSYRPATVYEVQIPRTLTTEAIRAEGVWAVESDEASRVSCYPISIRQTDARWVVVLAIQRRDTL